MPREVKKLGAWENFLDEPVNNYQIYAHNQERINQGGTVENDVFENPTFDYEVCFVAGTQILMADGSTKPIEQIRPGDQVLAADHLKPEEKPTAANVVRFFDNGEKEVVKLSFEDDQEIICTPGHRFYVIDKGWVHAQDLQSGDLCLSAIGEKITFLSSENLEEKQRVYNVEVEEKHTYYIANKNYSLLVHNVCPICHSQNCSGPSSYWNPISWLWTGEAYACDNLWNGAMEGAGASVLNNVGTVRNVAEGVGYIDPTPLSDGIVAGTYYIEGKDDEMLNTMMWASLGPIADAKRAARGIEQVNDVRHAVSHMCESVEDVAKNKNSTSFLKDAVIPPQKACFVAGTQVVVGEQITQAAELESADVEVADDRNGVYLVVAATAATSVAFKVLEKKTEERAMNELNNVPENVEENAERESLRQNATEKKNLKRNRANSEPEKSRLTSWFAGVSLFFLIVSLGTLLGFFISNNVDFKTSESVLASNVASDVSNAEQQTTKYVTKNIEDIQEGDEVLAYDVRASEPVKSKVSATFHLKSDHLRYLTVLDANGSEQTFQTTDTHPFWVNSDRPDLFRKARDSVSEYDVSTNSDINFEHDNLFVTESGYYVEAKDLKEGDRFIAPSGESSFLVKTWRESQPEGIDVYNFKVTDNSNYFVIAQYADFQNGAEPVLVHNAKDCHRKSAGRSDPHGDSGRELEKAYKQIEQYKKQIDELKQQHGTARKIKDIQNKIQRVQQEAQKKNKGETHWRRGK